MLSSLTTTTIWNQSFLVMQRSVSHPLNIVIFSISKIQNVSGLVDRSRDKIHQNALDGHTWIRQFKKSTSIAIPTHPHRELESLDLSKPLLFHGFETQNSVFGRRWN